MKENHIKEIRENLGLNQREFSDEFGIPLGTLRNWEQGLTTPPEYVNSMIMCSMLRDRTINVETLRFLKMIEELSSYDSNEIDSFKNANEKNYRDKLFYDEKKEEIDHELKLYPIVADACLVDNAECYHHDIISYYDSYTKEYKIRLIIAEDESKYIQINIFSSDMCIIIENGDWYFV